MTTRERTSLVLIVAGAVGLVAGAYGYDGWRAAVVVAGLLALVCGVLLGIDDTQPSARPDAVVFEDDYSQDGQP